MAIIEGSNINFYKGTKEKLLSNLTEMNVNYARQTRESIQKINQSTALLTNV